jgi:hypothetical protein
MVLIHPEILPIMEVQEKMNDLLEEMKEGQRIHNQRMKFSLRILWVAVALNFFSFLNNLLGWI